MDTINTSLTVHDLSLSTRPPIDLWNQAVQKLDEADKQQIDFNQPDRRLVLDELLKVVRESKRLCDARQWKYKKSNGEIVLLRESLERVVEWVKKFREVGDVVAQYDPVHASLPWAGIRILLQIAISHTEACGALIKGVEIISRLIARYAKVERLYLRNISDQEDLRNSITELYTAILIYLTKAKAYYLHSTPDRIIKSTFQVSSDFDKYLKGIARKATEVDSIARLIDADFIQRMARFTYDGLKEINYQISALEYRLEDIQLNSTMIAATAALSLEDSLTWLNPTFTDEDYEKVRDRRTPGTCRWIQENSQFQTWASSNTGDELQIFWIHGPAGSGKTFLSASVVQHLRDKYPNQVACFFCDSGDEAKRQPLTIVRSWVAQIVRQQQEALDVVREMYNGKEGRPATASDVWQLFKTITQRIPGIFFVVDGFDECNVLSSEETARFLRDLVNLSAEISGNLFIASREDIDIATNLRRFTESSRVSLYQHRVSESDTKDDITTFALHVIDERLRTKSSQLKEEIAHKASERCEGMFLWIKLLSLELRIGQNAKKLHEIVDKTPSGLDSTYERDIARIQNLGEETGRAFAILRWTLFAIRPLTVRELTEALIVNDSHCQRYPRDDLPDTWDEEEVNDEIRRLCGSLIELRTGSEQQSPQDHTVHFVHFSVREYLRTSIVTFPNCVSASLAYSVTQHDLLARTCLRYLSYDEVIAGSCGDAETLLQHMNVYGFLRYAARYWYIHAQKTEEWSNKLIDLTNWYFKPDASRWSLWSKVLELEGFEVEKDIDHDVAKSEPISPLYYVCWLGFMHPFRHLQDHLQAKTQDFQTSVLLAAARNNNLEILEALIEELNIDVNARKKNGYTALWLAAQNGHIEVVKTLISRNAETDVPREDGVTPLYISAQNGHHKIVKTLLGTGADPNAVSEDGMTPLHAAAQSGDVATVEIIVDYRVDLQPRCGKGLVPLHHAVIGGHHQVIQFMIDHQAEVNIGDATQSTPLHYAANNGHYEAVRILLYHGAEVDARREDDDTSLCLAACNGHCEIVKALLQNGAGVNAHSQDGTTSLHLAAINGHVDIVEVLISHGAALNPKGLEDCTPLHLAAFDGHHQVVQYLTQHGVDVQAKREDGATALHFAAQNNHLSTAILLLDHHAILDAKVKAGWTPMFLAAQNGHVGLVKILIDRGADVNLPANAGRTPLHAAALHGHIKVIQALIDQFAQVDLCDEDGYTPLHLAIHNGHFECAEILISNCADVNACSSDGHTPLLLAADQTNVELFRLLVTHGANVNAKFTKGETVLHRAISKGNLEISKMLMAADADIEVVNQDGWSPLQVAVSQGHLEISQMLIDHGARFDAGSDRSLAIFNRAAEDGHSELVRILIDQIDGSGSKTVCSMMTYRWWQ